MPPANFPVYNPPMSARVTSQLWVQAYLRRVEIAGGAAFLVRRGFETAGDIVIKISLLDGRARLLRAASDPEGGRRWINALGAEPAPEAEAEALIARALERDPDLWVIEVEDRQDRHFLDEPVDAPG